MRYLPASHPRYDKVFANDACNELPTFSLGPHACIVRELGLAEARLFISKLLWQFDVVKACGEALNMKGLEQGLLHYGFLTKPQVRVRFLAVQRKD